MKAGTERFGKADLPELFDGARSVTVAKGKKVVVLQRTDRGFAEAVLGPTGNLRAPTARVGAVWLVGFHEAAWAELLG